MNIKSIIQSYDISTIFFMYQRVLHQKFSLLLYIHKILTSITIETIWSCNKQILFIFYCCIFQIDNGFHLMEIEALESKKANHLSITLIHEHKPVSILIGKLIASIVC